MAPVVNGRYIFRETVTGFPEPGKHMSYDASQTIDLDSTPLNGGILVKVLALSIDPYLRNRMRDPSIPSAFPTFTIGEPLDNNGIGIVLRSENPKIKQGATVYAILPFQHYAILSPTTKTRVVDDGENLPPSVYVGVCGMPGQTADYGWKEFARPKKGDVVFVTAAAGPVGATVVQIAKAEGLKVIASAGTDDKVAFVKSIGADVAFNYKTTSTREVLKKEGPVNIYWDNVGGESLEATIDFSAHGANFIICGSISGYNKESYHVKNLQQLVWHELKFNGFLVTSLMPKYDEQFYKTFPHRVASGEIKYKEHLVRGLENAGQALLDQLSGKNFGKVVLVVADE